MLCHQVRSVNLGAQVGSDVNDSESVVSLRADNQSGTGSFNAWDYIHINSIDVDDQGDFLLSGRHTNTLYKVSRQNGTILWRLGGHNSTFSIPQDAIFAFQHDARFLSRSADGKIEIIFLFDNAARSDNRNRQASGQRHSVSSTRIFQLNHTDHTTNEINRFVAPDGISAASQGNAQVLPDGNVFVNWGQAGAITEFRGSDARPIFHAYLGSHGVGAQSYRGFRYEWTGRSRETLAVAAPRRGEEVTDYVSWIGDTVTRAWVFQARVGAQSVRIGEKYKTSFETRLVASSGLLEGLVGEVKISPVALGDKGEVLGESEEAEVQDDLYVGCGSGGVGAGR